ncbi:MAG: molybdopterin-dependent oxidoreductase [Actinobacteria bacterium]|nr:molybdopterin-dependent oxidoreductase [Actinomycetota bacterium]
MNLRVGPFREGTFTSPLHDERLAAWLGAALGITITVCFATGLVSHGIQNPPSWFTWPSRPVNLYRVTQGLHVMMGIASIPLLLAKLWVVYPHFWTWPILRGLTSAVERLFVLVLIAGSLLLLSTGVVNIAYWYSVMPFNFVRTHFWTAWLVVGALVVHIGAKTTTTRAAFSRGRHAPIEGSLTRRGFLVATGAAAGALALTVVGETVAPLKRLAVLAPRRIGTGPQGVPVNKSAAQAGVVKKAKSDNYRLKIDGKVATPLRLTLADLRALPQHHADLPITCVEGWSAAASWSGPRISDLLEAAGAEAGARVTVQSLQKGGSFATSDLEPSHIADPDCLLALDLGGEALHIDHGFPARLIAPNRPGVLQTKWVARLEVS